MTAIKPTYFAKAGPRFDNWMRLPGYFKILQAKRPAASKCAQRGDKTDGENYAHYKACKDIIKGKGATQKG